MSQPWFAVSAPPTAAPMPTNAIWPRLTWPAQPVSTTSEMPDDPEDHDDRGEVDLRLGEPEREREQRGEDDRAERPARVAHLGDADELAGHRPHLACGLPGRDVAGRGCRSGAW